MLHRRPLCVLSRPFAAGLTLVAALVPVVATTEALPSPPLGSPSAASKGPPVDAPTLEVRGRVLGEEGHGLRGARVELLTLEPRYRGLSRLLSQDLEPQILASTLTDAQGRYRLAGPTPAMWRIRVHAEGRLPLELAPVPAPLPGPPVEISAAVPPAAVTAVPRVEGPPGQPSPASLVFLVPRGSGTADARGWRPASRIGLTDEKGEAHLSQNPGERLLQVAYRPGLLPVGGAYPGPSLRPLQTSQRDLYLQDFEGRPQGSVLVRLPPWGVPVTASGPDGRVSVPSQDLSAPLELRFLLPNGIEQRMQLAPLAEGTGSRPEPVTVAAGERLAGRVQSALTGGSLEGALVWSLEDPGRFAVTDARGRFDLALPSGGGRVQAMAAGHRPRSLEVDETHFSSRRLPTLALPGNAQLTGRVVDLEGRPVPEAEIAVDTRFDSVRPYESPDRADARARSGDDGTFSLPRLEPERSHRLHVTRPGYLDATAETATTAPGRALPPLTVVLIGDRSATGRIVDEGTQAVMGAEIVLTHSGRPRPRAASRGGNDPHAAVSGDDGRFRIPGVPAEVLDVHVLHPGFLPMTVRGVEVPRGSQEVSLGELVLIRGSRLEGQVVTSEQQPVSGARVQRLRLTADARRLGDDLWSKLAEGTPVVTDGAGFFVLSGLEPSQKLDLLVSHDDHAPTTVQHVEVPTTAPLVIELPPGFPVFGRIVDEDGAPVGEAQIELRLGRESAPGEPDRTSHRAAVSSDDGRFRIPGALEGPARLQIYAPDLVPPEPLEIQIPGDTREELLFELSRGSELRGRITTEDDEPVAEARILAGAHVANSDSDGFYRMTGLPRGPARFELTHPAYPSQLEEITIEAGTNRLDVTLPSGVPVRGRVVDAGGSPVAGVRVTLERLEVRHRVHQRTISDRDGVFELSTVTPGTYAAQARRPGKAPVRLEGVVVAKDPIEDLELVLPESTTVVGNILGLDFDELARVSVRANNGGELAFPGTVSYDGRYRIEDLPPGPFLIRARTGDGRRQAQRRVVIPGDGGEVHVDLELGQHHTVTGQVLLDGEPLVAASLSLRGLDQSVSRAVRTDHEGRFRMEDVPPGNYHLGVSHRRELTVHNQPLTIDGDRDILVDLAPALVAGHLLDEEGRVVAGAQVIFRRLVSRPGEEGLLAIRSNEAGRFHFVRVPPGRYRLEVRADGFSAHDEVFTVAAGERLDQIEVVLTRTPGLTVAVTTPAGIPPAAMFAVLDPTGATLLEGIRPTDASGTLHLSTVPEGNWRLLVSAPGAETTAIDPVSIAEPVAVELAPEAALDIRILPLETTDLRATAQLLDPTGQPLQALDIDQGLTAAWPLIGGRGTLRNLPTGTWQLQVTTSDGQTWQQAVTTAGGAVAVVELR